MQQQAGTGEVPTGAYKSTACKGRSIQRQTSKDFVENLVWESLSNRKWGLAGQLLEDKSTATSSLISAHLAPRGFYLCDPSHCSPDSTQYASVPPQIGR